MTPKSHKNTRPKVCRKCSKVNASDALVCTKCNSPLPRAKSSAKEERSTPEPMPQPKVELITKEADDGSLVMIEESTGNHDASSHDDGNNPEEGTGDQRLIWGLPIRTAAIFGGVILAALLLVVVSIGFGVRGEGAGGKRKATPASSSSRSPLRKPPNFIPYRPVLIEPTAGGDAGVSPAELAEEGKGAHEKAPAKGDDEDRKRGRGRDDAKRLGRQERPSLPRGRERLPSAQAQQEDNLPVRADDSEDGRQGSQAVEGEEEDEEYLDPDDDLDDDEYLDDEYYDDEILEGEDELEDELGDLTEEEYIEEELLE